VSNLTEIDRLIEEGLTLYGQGDLDGALLAWERVLAIDPESPQANSYVDYVRQNYELLTNEVTAEHHPSAPFAIADDEEPEYQIEILPGELIETPPPMHMDPADAGWFIEDESNPRRSQTEGQDVPDPRTISHDLHDPRTRTKSHDLDDDPLELELEADEPPPPPGAPEIELVTEEPQAISFDDQTREYPGGPPVRRAADLPSFDSADPVTSEFHPEGTPGFGTPADYQTPPGGFQQQQVTPGFETLSSEFRTQVTDVVKRDTGFVRPATQSEPAHARAASQGPPELKMTLRTPGGEGRSSARPTPPPIDPDDPFPELQLTGDTPPPPPDPSDAIHLSYDEQPAVTAANVEMLDLIDSLPNPRPSPMTSMRKATEAEAARPATATGEPAKPSTRDFPPANRPPAPPAANTRDFAPQKTEKLPSGVRFTVPDQPAPPVMGTPTRDMQTGRIPTFGREMAGAPTRDLGLRAAAAEAKLGDEEPTATRAPRSLAGDSTRNDLILAFDPIDARSAQILEEVDANVPEREAKEDRTRRRITTLFEHALEWSKAGELDRAVTAVDLALSEDPNSALAQKLIHRNRDTMMNVFQTFLGDLQRQPHLARPLHELANSPISPRAAFLLSRVDGSLSLDEILDVSGMPRLEAYRYLCQLFLRGILR
jgi:hypothetical protein